MKVYFDKLYKDDRNKELCGLCVPFSKGSLMVSDVDNLAILDGGTAVPLQCEVTSRWDDGSVRYAYLHFLADIPGNRRKELELVADAALKSSFSETIDIIESQDTTTIDNGPLKFTLRNSSENLFDKFEYNNRSFSKEQFIGPFVSIDGDGLKTVFDEWKVVKEGRLFTVIEGRGRCLSSGEKSFSGQGICFEVRLSITAGKPWIDAGLRLINCTDGNIKPDDIIFAIKSSADADLSLSSPAVSAMGVDSTGCGDTRMTTTAGNIVTTTGTKDLPNFDFGVDGSSQSGPVRTIVGKSNYRTEFKISTCGAQVENTIIAEMLEKEANEHFAEVLYGTFFADYTDSDKDVGVCATVFQAFQNFPKAVKADENGIVVYIIPDQNENSKVSKAEPVVFTSGMARETRFLLHFHDASEPIYELDNRSLIYQMPDRPYIAPEEFEKAGVMPDIFLPVDKQNDDVEIALIEKADSHARCYGMLNFGDAPDPGYTSQGRGGGNLVWTNNEYDYPHAMYMMYARTGIRRFLDYANVAAWHWMDVDVCHYSSDPLRMGGQWEHTRKHTGGSEEGLGCKGEMVCSHEWVEGLLDLYHFTADERALNTALGIGENVLRLLDTPMYQVPGEASARETGWALRTLTALFIETGDKKWIGKCEWIVSQFEQWNNRYGNWLAPYTDNTTIRVGFMISVALGSLMRYYRVFPSDSLKDMMIRAIDDLAENYMTPQGLFYYKELPSLSRNGTNTLLLEAMAIGYELTKDTRYLDYGKKTFQRAIVVAPSSVGNKRIAEDAVLVGNGPTKNFAQSFLPITCYYVQLAHANRTVL